MSGLNWKIYFIWNHTRKDIYVGISENYKNRWEEHKKGKVSTTSSWFKSGDKIDFKLYSSAYSSKETASLEAHRIEREAISAEGYRLIKTAGW